MKPLLALLLVAGTVLTTIGAAGLIGSRPRVSEYEIRIDGGTDGFHITYVANKDSYLILRRVYHFRVHSLTEIQPTPDAMKAKGYEEEK